MGNRVWLTRLSFLALIIFGGGFLIRFMRDGEFYVVEFTASLIAAVILIAGIFINKQKSPVKD